jgi:hypothetical protein
LLVNCNGCNQAYGKKENVLNTNTTDVISNCAAANVIPNCKTLSNEYTINDYTFVCMECETNFYLESNNLVCKQRLNIDG